MAWTKTKTETDASPERRALASAFTLIELLVMIAVLGILAALLLPVLARAKARAAAATCANHLHQMSLALHLYVHENAGRYPYIVCRADPVPETAAQAHWFGRPLPYHPIEWTNRLYHCPGYHGAIWVETGAMADHDPFGSYAYNWDGVRGHMRSAPGSPDCLGLGLAFDPKRQTPAVSKAQIRAPSQLLAMGESRFRRETSITNFHYADCVDGTFCGFLSREPPDPDAGAVLPARHGKKYNQLFCDGHLDILDPWVLFNPTRTAQMWNADHEAHAELWPPE